MWLTKLVCNDYNIGTGETAAEVTVAIAEEVCRGSRGSGRVRESGKGYGIKRSSSSRRIRKRKG